MRKAGVIGIIATPFLIIIILSYVAAQRDILIDLTPVEVEVYHYSTDKIVAATELKKKSTLSVPSRIHGPIHAARGITVEERKHETPAVYRVSFILIAEDDRRAVINEHIVREGDRLDGMKVMKIEGGRVALMTNGALRWLDLEAE